MRRWQKESVLDLYNLLLAALLFIAPWLFRLTNGPGRMDMWATGAVIALISLAALIAYKDWEEWVNVVLGLWLIASPWFIGFAHTRAMHFSIAAGIIIAFLAVLDLWLHYDAAHAELPPQDRAGSSPA